MKNKIKSYLPKFMINFFKFLSFKVGLMQDYIKDYRRYSKNAFENPFNNSEIHLKAKISLYTHTLEKGLSHVNPRFGFGKSTVIKLIEVIKTYMKRGFSMEDIRFRSGLSVLKSYVNLHIENTNQIEDIIFSIKKDSNLFNEIDSITTSYGGSIELTKVETCINNSDSFFDILRKRVSIRNFSSTTIDENKLNKAIEMSLRTPSACNRQPWQVYVIQTNDIIAKTLGYVKA